jgi:hypothetical protein
MGRHAWLLSPGSWNSSLQPECPTGKWSSGALRFGRHPSQALQKESSVMSVAARAAAANPASALPVSVVRHSGCCMSRRGKPMSAPDPPERAPSSLIRKIRQALPRLLKPAWTETQPMPALTEVDIDLDALQSAPAVHWLQLDLDDEEQGWTTQPAVSSARAPSTDR